MIINKEKTQEELNSDIVNGFVEYLNNVVDGTENRIQALFTQFWADADVINDSLGTESGKLFTLLGSMEALLEQYDTDYEKSVAPREFTLNKDGSVTLAEVVEEVVEEVIEE